MFRKKKDATYTLVYVPWHHDASKIICNKDEIILYICNRSLCTIGQLALNNVLSLVTVLFITARNKVCEGYVLTGVCLSTGGGRGHAWQGVYGRGHA